MSPAAEPSAARLRIVAVVVAHDGSSWLPRLLTALEGSSQQPDVLLGVDTGSVDDSAAVLARFLGEDHVVAAPRESGFGTAVATGLAAVSPSTSVAGRHSSRAPAEEWVWLLHDDCAPAPDALERLVEVAASDPSIAAVGCRIRAWPNGRRLLEVGVTMTSTGRRETGLEPGEHDQGQYDDVRDVLAVSSAGMLVRRSAWEALGGFDPRMPLFRDDVDFGWRASAAGYRVVVAPRAVLFHVEAASRGVRNIGNAPRRPHQADRAAAIYAVLANCRAAAVLFLYLRFVLGSLLRAVGYLLGKLPGAAWDEVVAAVSVLGRPDRLVTARRWRRRQRAGSRASVRGLLPPWWTPYANGAEAVMGRVAETLESTAGAVASSARRLRPGTAEPDHADHADHGDHADHAVTGAARHPLLALMATLTIVSLIATRGLWGGGGFLQGGALLPAPNSAADWWGRYLESWHPVGLGSGLGTAPYVALLALPATLLLGKAWLLVDLVMLLAAPLAGLGAWFATSRLVSGLGARAWTALTYGLVPIVTGAVTSGHLGTVVVAILLPWLARCAFLLLDLDAIPQWSTGWAAGLMLSVATAFAPICWPIAAVVAILAVGWLVSERQVMRVGQWLLALAVPLVILLPWSWRVASNPGLLLREAGAVDAPGRPVAESGWQLAFGRLGAIGQAPWWLWAGLTFVAVVALLRRDTRIRVAAAWLVGAVGLAAAVVMGSQPVTLPLGAGEAYPWVGVPVLLFCAAAIAAAGMAADGLGAFIGSGAFGWRQPLAVVALVAGLSGPLLTLGWWLAVAPHGDLGRGVAIPVPAYMVDAMASDDQRVLLLDTAGPVVRYQVLAGDGLRLGDESVVPDSTSPVVATLVGDLLSTGDPADVRRLARLGVGYVVLPTPSPDTPGHLSATEHLDALAGLSRTSTSRAVLSGWQVAGPLTIAAPAHAGDSRKRWVVGQLVGWVVVVILAAPGVRRRPLHDDGVGA